MTLRGASGTPPPTMIWQGFSLPQTGTAAWGQAALRPPFPQSVGAGHARPATLPLPPVFGLFRTKKQGFARSRPLPLLLLQCSYFPASSTASTAFST